MTLGTQIKDYNFTLVYQSLLKASLYIGRSLKVPGPLKSKPTGYNQKSVMTFEYRHFIFEFKKMGGKFK